MSNKPDVKEICKAAFEMAEMCDGDLSGEIREFYNPRIRDIFVFMTRAFPSEMMSVLSEIET